MNLARQNMLAMHAISYVYGAYAYTSTMSTPERILRSGDASTHVDSVPLPLPQRSPHDYQSPAKVTDPFFGNAIYHGNVVVDK